MMCNDFGMSTLEEAHFGVMLSGVYASSQHKISSYAGQTRLHTTSMS